MRRIIFVFSIIFALLLFLAIFTWFRVGDDVTRFVETTISNVEAEKEDPIINSGTFTWYQDSLGRYNLAVFNKPLQFYFSSKQAHSLKEQALDKDLDVAINGSYFIGSYINAQHSGLLQIKGERISEYVSNVQVSHVIVYNHKLDTIEFIRAKEFDPAKYEAKRFTLVQTGPLMIRENEVQDQFISGSLNGKAQAFRTLLGITESGKRFMVVTRTAFNLTDLAEEILKNPVLEGEVISLINLDGGASTAMYSADLKQMRFRENVRLPLVIGVKKD